MTPPPNTPLGDGDIHAEVLSQLLRRPAGLPKGPRTLMIARGSRENLGVIFNPNNGQVLPIGNVELPSKVGVDHAISAPNASTAKG